MAKAKNGTGTRRTQERTIPSRHRRLPTAHDSGSGRGKRYKREATSPTAAPPTCRVIHPEASQAGKQGLTYFPGVSAEATGSQGLCMHLQTIPPGGRARAHLHASHETAIYVISGAAEMWYGEALQQHLMVQAGDFLYIPAGMPHLPANCSQTEPCVAVIARTDPNEQESVIPLPEMDSYIQP